MDTEDGVKMEQVALLPPISIVVPVHVTSEELLAQFCRCLQSLKELRGTPDEIIVVLDGAHEANHQAGALAEAANCTVLQLPRSRGPSAARNAGARKARGDFLFFVDADCEAAPNSLEVLTAAFAAHPGISAVFGSYDDAPAAANFLSQFKNLMHHWTHQNSAEEASTFWGACGAIRRTIFLESGGFDERFWFLEDVDLGYRLKRGGHRIRLEKTLHVKHGKWYTAPSLLKSDFRGRALPWTHLILRERNREGEVEANLNIDRSSRASVALTFLLAALLPFCAKWRGARLGVLACAAGLLFLNWRTYAYLHAKRGGGFVALSVLWHWLYFLYGGLGFLVGAFQFLVLGDDGMGQPKPD